LHRGQVAEGGSQTWQSHNTGPGGTDRTPSWITASLPDDIVWSRPGWLRMYEVLSVDASPPPTAGTVRRRQPRRRTNFSRRSKRAKSGCEGRSAAEQETERGDTKWTQTRAPSRERCSFQHARTERARSCCRLRLPKTPNAPERLKFLVWPQIFQSIADRVGQSEAERDGQQRSVGIDLSAHVKGLF